MDNTANHTARQIAEWFLAWGEHNDAPLSNLKLQKLLYYAQGHYLGDHAKPLFEDEIEAWVHGPVVRSIYHFLKSSGRGPIDVDKVVGDDFNWDSFRDVEEDLMRVWNTYGKYEAWALRERTHREDPWKSTFDHEARYRVIPKEIMQKFFAR